MPTMAVLLVILSEMPSLSWVTSVSSLAAVGLQRKLLPERAARARAVVASRRLRGSAPRARLACRAAGARVRDAACAAAAALRVRPRRQVDGAARARADYRGGPVALPGAGLRAARGSASGSQGALVREAPLHASRGRASAGQQGSVARAALRVNRLYSHDQGHTTLGAAQRTSAQAAASYLQRALPHGASSCTSAAGARVAPLSATLHMA